MNGLTLDVIQPGQQRRRVMRTPAFPIAGGIKPQGLYPYFFAPVLPVKRWTSQLSRRPMCPRLWCPLSRGGGSKRGSITFA